MFRLGSLYLSVSLIFLTGCFIAACGKKGEPTTPYQIPSHFPRTYPPEKP